MLYLFIRKVEWPHYYASLKLLHDADTFTSMTDISMFCVLLNNTYQLQYFYFQGRGEKQYFKVYDKMYMVLHAIVDLYQVFPNYTPGIH